MQLFSVNSRVGMNIKTKTDVLTGMEMKTNREAIWAGFRFSRKRDPI